MKEIVVVGIGYVGVSIGVMFSRYHNVTMIDIVEEKVNQINRLEAPIKDDLVEDVFKEAQKGRTTLHLKAMMDGKDAYKRADYVIVAVPTDYNPSTNYFDCSAVENVVQQVLEVDSDALLIVKSTIPIGYTKDLCEKYNTKNILFSPEFLRESYALFDVLHPSRIIVSCNTDNQRKAEEFAILLRDCSENKEVRILFTGSEEAEAIKLFSNSYLALRVAFFNELDTFADMKGLNTKEIIQGVALDPRIGSFYNNPSFGYGGYCLPKDTKQLLANFEDIPQKLFRAVVESNQIRKQFIADRVSAIVREISGQPVIGVYRLTMKQGSEDIRQSAIQDIIERLLSEKHNILLYEPSLEEGSAYLGCDVTHDLLFFKSTSSIILANRRSQELEDVKDKVYSRDILGRD